jgi:PadR family transcriptional regulator PadR
VSPRNHRGHILAPKLDMFRGTLDVLILKALSWGPQHGYAITRWIRERTDAEMLIEEGALYPALYRLEAQELVESSWGTSENNRRAKFYKLTVLGRRRLRAGSDVWNRYAAAVARILDAQSGPEPEKP